MKRAIFISFITFLVCLKSQAQMLSSAVYITKTYAQSGNFYIKSIPYDNEEPSLKGRSSVFDKNDHLIYTIGRCFNGVKSGYNFIGISNDGNTLVYVVSEFASEKDDGLSSVSIYRKGNLVKSFSQKQVTGCDPQNEKCSLIYRNGNKVIDRVKSGSGKNYRKVFKDSVSDEEKFLNENAVLVLHDSLFITSPDKLVHIIDIKHEKLAGAVTFEHVYPEFKRFYVKHETAERFDTPNSPDKSSFPNLKNGDTTCKVLAAILGLKAVYVSEKDFYRYKTYGVKIEAYISRDGTIDIQKLDADKKLPLDTIKQFFNNHKYDISFVPSGIDKWYFRYFLCAFRNKSDKQALQDKLQQEKDRLLERERRKTLDTIKGVYIPRNLEECFIELDKKLPNVTKIEIRSQKSRSDMIMYHLSLGMWIRNNFGLNGGSRLVKYFEDHGIIGRYLSLEPEAEGLSGFILEEYYDWLNGNKNAAKEWEQKNPLQTTYADLKARWAPYTLNGLPTGEKILLYPSYSVFENKGTGISAGSFTIADSLGKLGAFMQVFKDDRLRQLMPEKQIAMTCIIDKTGRIQEVEFLLDSKTLLTGTELGALENELKNRVVFKLNAGNPIDDFYRVSIKEFYQNILDRKP